MGGRSEPWVDLRQAARHIGVDPDTLRAWCRREDDPPPHSRIGGKGLYRFDLRALDDWVRKRGNKIEDSG
jgi:hypothetical protein